MDIKIKIMDMLSIIELIHRINIYVIDAVHVNLL